MDNAYHYAFLLPLFIIQFGPMFKLLRVNWFGLSQQLSIEQFKKTKLTKLNDRSLLILNGPDSHKYILPEQTPPGTNDQRQDEESFHKVALYTVFLQPKGKVITDAFVFKPRIYRNGKAEYASDQLWIDVSKSSKSLLKEHLKRHMWKKQVELVDVEKEAEGKEEAHVPTIYSGYNEESLIMSFMLGGSVELPELEEGEDETYANLIYFDPRGEQFGLRIVSSQEQIEIEGHYEVSNSEDHQRTYERLGEIPHNLALNKLPFQFNYDLLNAISLKKGCYIGQEIVSRGLLTGIIRRRIFPFTMNTINGIFPQLENDTVLKSNDEEIGKVVAYSNGQGLALINYLPFLEKKVSWPIEISAPYKGTLLSPMASKLQRYYTQMKGKQRKLQQLDL